MTVLNRVVVVGRIASEIKLRYSRPEPEAATVGVLEEGS